MFRVLSIVFLFVSHLAYAKSCETKRELFIENPATKVWKTTICPQQTLPFHTHEYSRVVIPEDSGTLKVIYASGRETVINLEKQMPIFLSKLQGKESHQDLNIGSNILHVTVIELKGNA